MTNIKGIFKIVKHFGAVRTLKTLAHPKRRYFWSSSPKGGSAWWAFPFETVRQILDYLNGRPDVLRYHDHTHLPDETFFHSIIDEIKPDREIGKSVTYVNWLRNGVSLPVSFETSDDLRELLALEKDFLFARKFDARKSSDLLDDLDSKVVRR